MARRMNPAGLPGMGSDMVITSIKPRRDGKFLVGLYFAGGRPLRKVMSAEQLAEAKAKAEVDAANPPRVHRTGFE